MKKWPGPGNNARALDLDWTNLDAPGDCQHLHGGEPGQRHRQFRKSSQDRSSGLPGRRWGFAGRKDWRASAMPAWQSWPRRRLPSLTRRWSPGEGEPDQALEAAANRGTRCLPPRLSRAGEEPARGEYRQAPYLGSRAAVIRNNATAVKPVGASARVALTRRGSCRPRPPWPRVTASG